MPLVYASGPISDQDYRGSTAWYYVVEEALNPHIRLVMPMRGKEFMKGRPGRIGHRAWDHVFATGAAIAGRDQADTERCDAVLMNLLPATRVSIGCMIEAGWATAGGQRKKPLVLVMQPGNPHEGHAILEQLATYRVPTLEDAVMVLNVMFANG